MSSSRDDRYYNPGKSRRGTPAPDSQSSLFFQGQVTSTYPAPSRPNYDYAPHSGYSQWSSNTGHMHDSPVPYYESPDHGSGYAAQPNYPAYHSRPSPHHSTYNSGESRKLPPLNTSSISSYGRDDRYHAYSDASVHSSSSNPNIRSPVASYPASYTPYGNIDSSYGYPQMQSHFPHPSADTRSASPYRSSTTHPTSPTSNSPPPAASPTTPEGNTPAKKKRKRADAHQLKILTDTYNRTAFPSTEERQRLAKELDMTPRSVQIWFQNRRQTFRQTKGTSTNLHRTQPLSLSPTSDESTSGYASDASPFTSGHHKSASTDDRRQYPRY